MPDLVSNPLNFPTTQEGWIDITQEQIWSTIGRLVIEDVARQKDVSLVEVYWDIHTGEFKPFSLAEICDYTVPDDEIDEILDKVSVEG